MRANYSRRNVLSVDLRGDKLGKEYFGQKSERFSCAKYPYEWIVTDVHWLAE